VSPCVQVLQRLSRLSDKANVRDAAVMALGNFSAAPASGFAGRAFIVWASIVEFAACGQVAAAHAYFN